MCKIQDNTVKEDESAEFTCQLNPSATNVNWLLNGNILQDDSNVKITLENGISKLRILKCQLNDNGEIACLIGDKKNKISTAKLTVQGYTNFYI